MQSGRKNATVAATLRCLAANPYHLLVAQWNRKSAVLSSLMRGGIFFGVNLRAGIDAALGAMFAEFVFRLATAGFYGALTQSFRRTEPAWQAALAVILMFPLLQHSLEFAIHWVRGTPLLMASVLASAIFTALSTLVNLHLMRHGAMIDGEGERSLREDLAAVPRILISPFRSRSPK